MDFWVFSYGSLMWRPGFDYIERRRALLHGLHRAFCVYSHIYRGTPEKPGLVLALDKGGACTGQAFRIAAAKVPEVVDYLRMREQVTAVYLETSRMIRLDGPGARKIPALCYLVDRAHHQYAGKLDLDRAVRLIRQGQGISGDNISYLENTVLHLREMGIHDRGLEALLARVHGV